MRGALAQLCIQRSDRWSNLKLERSPDLLDLPALRLRGGSALPHAGGLHPQAEAAPARRAPDQALSAVGTDVANEGWLGS